MKARNCASKSGPLDYACGPPSKAGKVKKNGKKCTGKGPLDYACGPASKGTSVKRVTHSSTKSKAKKAPAAAPRRSARLAARA